MNRTFVVCEGFCSQLNSNFSISALLIFGLAILGDYIDLRPISFISSIHPPNLILFFLNNNFISFFFVFYAVFRGIEIRETWGKKLEFNALVNDQGWKKVLSAGNRGNSESHCEPMGVVEFCILSLLWSRAGTHNLFPLVSRLVPSPP
jgi:hypothetical protein